MTEAVNDILFARQPIFDKNNKLFGFELLYRSSDKNFADFDDGDKATCELLVNYCSGIINSDDEPRVKLFINLTRQLILSDYFFPLEPARLVIEILEDTLVDELLVDKVKELKQKGYKFALDDYTFEAKFDCLLPYISYFKIDLMAIEQEQLKSNFLKLKEQINKSPNKLAIYLAEKVEERQEYNFCSDLGFDLFQGYYLERPQIIYGKKISNSTESALQVVTKMQETDLSIDDLCHVISRDTKLSYQLLKIVNSPICRLPRKVDSMKEAVVFLGLEQVKKWAMALVLSGNSNQPMELFRILLTRARTCEIYAAKKDFEKTESFFMIGLFSGIDAVMMAEKHWLLEKIGLHAEMNSAILEYQGTKGQVLEMVIALEHADCNATNRLCFEDQIDLFAAHEEAINWAHQLCLMI